jgi:glutaredoxin 3
MAAKIEIYTQKHCPWCHRTKALFKKKKTDFEEIMVTADSPEWDRMIERTGGRTTPQILIDGEAIGGYTELSR